MRLEVAGQMQFRASRAYLNSSSQTTWSEGRKIHTPLFYFVLQKFCLSFQTTQDKYLQISREICSLV